MADNTLWIEVEIEGKKGFATLKSDAVKAGEETGKVLAESTVDGLSSRLISLKGLIAGALTGAFASFVKSAVSAGEESAVAIRALETSLVRVGSLTENNTKFFIDQASQLQALTKISDEQALSYFALANNYARSAEEAVKLTRAALDLSSATGTDTATAIEMLGRSLNGVGGRLNQIIPGFQKTSEEALRAGAAVDFVTQKFGGDAEARYAGFSAAISKIAKSYNEMLESAGRVVTESPAVQSALKSFASVFDSLRLGIEFLAANFDNVAERALRFATIFGAVVLALNARSIFEGLSNSIANVGITLIKTAQESGSFATAIKAAFFSGELATKAFTLAVNISKAALTLGLTIAIDALITKFLELKDQCLSVFDALKVIFKLS